MRTTKKTVTSIIDLIQTVRAQPNDQILSAFGRTCWVKAERIASSKNYYSSGIDVDFIINETCYKMLQLVAKGKTFESENHFWGVLNVVLTNRFHDAMRTARANYNRPNWVSVSIEDILEEYTVATNSLFETDEQESSNNYCFDRHGQAFKNIACPGRKLSDEWLHPMTSTAEVLPSESQEADDLMDCLEDYLNPKNFAIFKDRTFGDLSSKEVAQKYGVTPNNVDQICSRGRSYLKKNKNRFRNVA